MNLITHTVMIFLILLQQKLLMGCFELYHEELIPGANITKVAYSANGSYMITANTNKSTMVFVRNGENYCYSQQFSGSSVIQNLYINKDATYFIVTRINLYQIYKFVAGNYILFQTETISDGIQTIMTEDKENVIVSSRINRTKMYKFSSGSYVNSQNLEFGGGQILDLDSSASGKYLVGSKTNCYIVLFQRNTSFMYSFDYFYLAQASVPQIKIIEADIVTVTFTVNNKIYIFKVLPTPQFESYDIVTAPFIIQKLFVSDDRKYMVVSGSNKFQVYQKNELSNLMTLKYEIQLLSATQIVGINMNQQQTQLIISISTGHRFYSNCPDNCLKCLQTTTCQQCDPGYSLDIDELCELSSNSSSFNSSSNSSSSNSSSNSSSEQQPFNSTMNTNICVDGITQQNGFCLYYCSPQCQSCSTSPLNCTQCSRFFLLNENNECHSKNQIIQSVGILFGILEILHPNKFKLMFQAIGDFKFYQYHQPAYKGTIQQIFEMSRVIQSKTSNLFDLSRVRFIDDLTIKLSIYNERSNEKYLSQERMGDSIPQNAINFIFQTIPITVLIFIFIKILFYCLFNESISRFIRPMSFNGYLFVMLFEQNIDRFVFLGFRNVGYLYHNEFVEKIYSVFAVLFVFPFFIYAFAAYPLFYRQYNKLFSYFLNNMFRVRPCIKLTSILFGVRPLLKGIIHSLYSHNTLQLILLSSVDFAIIFIFFFYEMRNKIFKSQLALMFLNIYLFSTILLNILLYLNVKHQNYLQLFLVIESCTEMVIYIRMGSITLSTIFNLFELTKLRIITQDQSNQDLAEDQQEQNDRSYKLSYWNKDKNKQNKQNKQKKQKKKKKRYNKKKQRKMIKIQQIQPNNYSYQIDPPRPFIFKQKCINTNKLNNVTQLHVIFQQRTQSVLKKYNNKK